MASVSSHHVSASMALLLATGESPVADESGISAGKSHHYQTHTDAHTYVLLDVLLDVDGTWVIVEANGSNAAGSIAHDGDAPRVQHLIETLEARDVGGDIVAIGYQADTPCRPEIYARAAQVATLWQERSATKVALVGPTTSETQAGPLVLVGTTEELAQILVVSTDGKLSWKGRTIGLLSNGNVVPALARRGHLDTRDLDLRVLHEGPTVAPLIHDKGAQQELAPGTGFRSLEWGQAATEVGALEMIRDMSRAGGIMVKINAGSGGTGVFPVSKGATALQIREALAEAFAKTVKKYGSMRTAFPVRAFEFATARPIDMGGGRKHLWDLRVEIISRPGSLTVTPLSARACPAPFDGTLRAASVIGNLTGTHDGAGRVIPADDLFHRLGLSVTQVEALAESAARWTVKALGAEW